MLCTSNVCCLIYGILTPVMLITVYIPSDYLWYAKTLISLVLLFLLCVEFFSAMDGRLRFISVAFLFVSFTQYLPPHTRSHFYLIPYMPKAFQEMIPAVYKSVESQTTCQALQMCGTRFFLWNISVHVSRSWVLRNCSFVQTGLLGFQRARMCRAVVIFKRTAPENCLH